MKLENIYNQYAKKYDAKYQNEIHKMEDDIVSLILQTQTKRNKSVLDLGCGTGHAITLGNIQSADYIGIDFSKAMIEDAKLKFPNHSFVHDDIVTMPTLWFQDFDVILAIYGQVNYIGLDSFFDILDKYSAPHGKFLAIIYAKKGHEDFSYTEEHQNYFTKDEILQKLEERKRRGVVKGFSFENEINFKDQLKTTITLDLFNMSDCKYYLISNFDILMEKDNYAIT